MSMHDKTMNVGELIAALKDLPSDLPVFTEGRDCWGDALRVERVTHDTAPDAPDADCVVIFRGESH